MDGLTSQGIEEVERIVNERNEAQGFVAHSTEPQRIRLFCAKTGEVKWVEIPASDLKATVYSVADLVEAESTYVEADSVQPTVWVTETKAVLHPRKDRKASITLPLRVNPAVAVLQKLQGLTPKALHRKLKVDLFATSIDPFDFAETIGSLKFETTDTADHKIRKGDESIAKTVRSTVTGEWSIPESVEFSFPFYPDLYDLNHDGIDTRVEIQCAVITEPSEGTVSIVPLPGTIEKATLKSMQKIAAAIYEAIPEGSLTKVFCGTC
jgi:hypothetical protein